jgi:hypothetical protein
MNYFFSNGCENLNGLTVTLNITEAIISEGGFSIQLNAGSSPGAGRTTFQQYAFLVHDNIIQAGINNYQDSDNAIVCDYIELCSTPFTNGIPWGYTLVIQLKNDSDGNVAGATYQVFDENNNQVANETLWVEYTACKCTGASVTCLGYEPGDLAPVNSVNYVIVGPGTGLPATFTSGEGIITYSVADGQQLTATTTQPACTKSRVSTAETSNASYGALTGCAAQNTPQSFSVTPQKPATCTTTNGPCTGVNGATQCMTINGVTQCCGSDLLWGNYPWITSCTDGTVSDKGCHGPCY